MRQPTPDVNELAPDRQVVDVQYYPLSGVVEVEMQSGTLLQFFRVPSGIADEFKASIDLSAYFVEHVEGKYHCQKLG